MRGSKPSRGDFFMLRFGCRFAGILSRPLIDLLPSNHRMAIGLSGRINPERSLNPARLGGALPQAARQLEQLIVRHERHYSSMLKGFGRVLAAMYSGCFGLPSLFSPRW